MIMLPEEDLPLHLAHVKQYVYVIVCIFPLGFWWTHIFIDMFSLFQFL